MKLVLSAATRSPGETPTPAFFRDDRKGGSLFFGVDDAVAAVHILDTGHSPYAGVEQSCWQMVSTERGVQTAAVPARWRNTALRISLATTTAAPARMQMIHWFKLRAVVSRMRWNPEKVVPR
jgi:hypothetical protein